MAAVNAEQKDFVFDENFELFVAEMKVAPSERLVQTSGADFAFSDRAHSIEMLAESSQKRFYDRKNHKEDKSFHPIPFLADGPGTGKSRFLQELPTSFKNHIMNGNYNEEFKKAMKDALFLNITFGNGSSYNDEELSLDIGKSVALRVMFQFQNQYKEFSGFLDAQTNVKLSLYSVISKISKHTSCLVLGIDEVNKIYDVSKKKLKLLLNAIGHRSCISPCFFVPVVAGTVIGPLSEYITGSTHPPLPIPLPLLSFESSKMILCKKNTKMAEMIEHNPEMSTLIADIGGHCRALEILFDSLGKFSADLQAYFDYVKNDVEIELERRYKISAIQLGTAIAHSVLGKNVHSNSQYPEGNDLTYQKLEEKGLVKIENQKLKIPYIFICCFIKRRTDLKYARFWTELLISGNIGWQDWEKFNRNYLVFRLSLYSYLEEESTTLRELFKGVKTSFPHGFDIKIQIPVKEKLEIIQAKERFPTSKNEPFPVGTGVLNAAGAPFDAFMYLETVKNEKLLVALQMKLANSDSKSPQIIDDNKINVEWNKMNKAISENLPGTNFVGVILGRCEGRFNENNLPGKCLVITKNEHEDYYGDLYYHRIQLV